MSHMCQQHSVAYRGTFNIYETRLRSNVRHTTVVPNSFAPIFTSRGGTIISYPVTFRYILYTLWKKKTFKGETLKKGTLDANTG